MAGALKRNGSAVDPSFYHAYSGPGNVTYEFQYNIRFEFIYDDEKLPLITDKDFPPTPVSITVPPMEEASWSPDFGNNFYGGQVKITVNATYGGGLHPSPVVIEPYLIRGLNPTPAAVRAYIPDEPWYAQRIANHESRIPEEYVPAPTPKDGFNQFNDINPCDLGYPWVSPDRGIGIMQLTKPTPSDRQIWNWQANVDGGMAKIADCIDYADEWMNSQTFPYGQIKQWENYNAYHDPDAPTPYPITYGDVTFSFDPAGNQKTYMDAVAIKMFNGAEGGNFLSWWKNDPTPPAQWDFNPLNKKPTPFNYVQRICETRP